MFLRRTGETYLIIITKNSLTIPLTLVFSSEYQIMFNDSILNIIIWSKNFIFYVMLGTYIQWDKKNNNNKKTKQKKTNKRNQLVNIRSIHWAEKISNLLRILSEIQTELFFFFWFGFYGPFKNISLISSRSFIEGGRKPENPEKNHLTIRKQNLAFPHMTRARLEPQRWET